MNHKIIFLSLVISLVTFSNVFSQNRSFDDILKMNLRNSGVILEDEEVRGYYLFYTLGKASKGKRNYLLRILDENLNDISTKKLEESKSVYLVEGSFNGEMIMLKFFNYKEKNLIHMTFDKSTKLVNRTERSLKKDTYGATQFGTSTNPLNNISLHDIEGEGFVDYSIVGRAKGYHIQFFSNDKNEKGWVFQSNTKDKSYQSAGYMCHGGNVLYNAVLKKKKLMTNQFSIFIQGIDMKTGKKIFEKEVRDQFVYQPLTAYYDKKKGLTNVMGTYFLAGSKTFKENGLGLFRYKIDGKGNVSEKTHLTWGKDISKFADVGKKGKVGGAYLYFHDIIQNPDGTVIAVAEQYKKAADAAGIAANVLGGRASSTKTVIDDMAIFHFNEDFSLKSLDFIEKTKTSLNLGAGYDFANIHLLSKLIAALGGFDYLFTQKNSQDESVSVGFLDYQKPEGGGRKKWMFGAITYADGKFSNDKIDLGTRSLNKIRVLPGKPGYLNVVEYNQKSKTINMHMERINY